MTIEPVRPSSGRIQVIDAVAGAAFLESMVAHWRHVGWQVEWVQSVGEHEYRQARTRVARLAVRWKMYGQQAWCAWRAAKSVPGDMVRVVTTNPFYAPALVKHASGHHGATVHLLYDLFPDALVQSDAIRANGLIARRIASVTRYALRECDATVFLGHGLREYAERAYGPARFAEVIPIGADGAPFRSAGLPTRAFRQDIGTILYAGLLGRMHDVDTLLGAIALGVPSRLRLRFAASGNRYARIRSATLGAKQVECGDPLDRSGWRSVMLDADVALVTIAPGAESIVMPSKTYSALVAGQAILAVCPPASDLAALVRAHDCGWIVEPGDVAGLHALWCRIVASPDEVLAKRQNAYRAGHAYYDSAVVAGRWEDLFARLLDRTRRIPARPPS